MSIADNLSFELMNPFCIEFEYLAQVGRSAAKFDGAFVSGLGSQLVLA